MNKTQRLLMASVALVLIAGGIAVHRTSDKSVFKHAKCRLLLLDPDNLDIQEYANIMTEPVLRIIENRKMGNYVKAIAGGPDVDSATAACVMLMAANVQRHLVPSNGVWATRPDELNASLSRKEIGVLATRLLNLAPALKSHKWLVTVTNDAAGPHYGGQPEREFSHLPGSVESTENSR